MFPENCSMSPLPFGQAQLWWMGQMGIFMKVGGTLLAVDYYASDDPGRQTPPPIPASDVTGVSMFLGTHDHLDHMDHASWRIFRDTCPEAVFVFPRMHLKAVLDDGIAPERLVPLNAGESAVIGDVTVHALPAAHEFLDRDPVTGLYPSLMYVVEGGGLRLFHAGDTVRYEGMLGSLRAFAPLDAAVLPINGRDAARYRRHCIGNMTFQEAVDLAGELKPRLVIPGHWDMFSGNSADPEDFRDYLSAKYGDGIDCLITGCGRMMTLEAQQPASR